MVCEPHLILSFLSSEKWVKQNCISAFNLFLTVMVFLKIPFSLGNQIFYSISHLRSHLFCFTVDLCLRLFHCMNVTALVMEWKLNCTYSVLINSVIHATHSSPRKAHPSNQDVEQIFNIHFYQIAYIFYISLELLGSHQCANWEPIFKLAWLWFLPLWWTHN